MSRMQSADSKIVKAESRAIPTEEFEPPAGFARESLGEMMKR